MSWKEKFKNAEDFSNVYDTQPTLMVFNIDTMFFKQSFSIIRKLITTFVLFGQLPPMDYKAKNNQSLKTKILQNF